MSTKLSVNLNKIALIRNSRDLNYPRIEYFAKLALDCGAFGLTIHPRPDQRHATYLDIKNLKEIVGGYAGRELNIEGKPTEKFLETVLNNKPHQVTLVPDADEQKTSDHGFNLKKDKQFLEPIIKELKEAKIRVSLFLDADLEQVPLAKEVLADRIELYTEPYARAYEKGGLEFIQCLKNFALCFDLAREIGLRVNAGHDLNLANLGSFVRACPVDEVSIGHALTVESLELSFSEVIRRYLVILS